MSLYHRVISGLVWSFSQTLAARLISLGVFAVLGRMLSPAAFGVVALAQAALDILALLVGQGTGAFLIYKEDLGDDHASVALWTNLTIALLLTGGVYAGAGWFAAAMGTPEVAPVLLWLAWTMPLQALSNVPTALLTREFRFRSLAIRTAVAAVIGGGGGIAAAYAGWGPFALAAQVLLSQIASTIALWFAVPWRPKLTWSRRLAMEQLRYGSGVTGAAILRIVATKLDTFLIGALLGVAPLGVYSVARRILQLASTLTSKSADSVAVGAFARQQGDLPALERSYQTALRLAVLIVTPMFTGLAVLANDVVVLLLGARWSEAGPVLQALCPAGSIMAIGYVNSAAARAVGKPVVMTLIQLLLLTLYLPLLALLFRFGIVAVAASFSLSLALALPIQFVLMRRRTPLRAPRWWLPVGLTVIAAGLMAAAMVATQLHVQVDSRAARVAVVSVLGIATYALAARLLLPTESQRLWQVVGTAMARRGGAG